MECPGCGAYSSSVIGDVLNGDPCRFCGLSSGARSEIWAVRAKRADKEVTERCEELIKLNAQAQVKFELASQLFEEIRHVMANFERRAADTENSQP